MPDPAKRIQLIEQSLRCFVYGWLSLIPVIGIGVAFAALRLHARTRPTTGDDWNPAGRYLRAGFWLAVLGTILATTVLSLFAIAVLTAS